MLLISSFIIFFLNNNILCSAKPNVAVQDIVEYYTVELPYVVGLKLTLCGTPFCSGTIINSEWILTAAQCVRDKQPTEIYIQYGVTADSSNEPKYVNATKIVVHKDFHKDGAINNIALIKLKRPLQLGRFAQPVQLPLTDMVVPVGSLVEHLKWISEENDQKMLKNLEKISLVTSSDCVKNFILHDPQTVTYKMSNICGRRPEYKSSLCLGYLGAPLMLNGYQIGLLSMGQTQCKYDKHSATYTEMAHYVNWIFKSISLELFSDYLNMNESNPTCTIEISAKNMTLFGCWFPDQLE